MEGVVGQLPAVEQLVVGAGVHDVSYTNVDFQHATWMGASGPYGFVDVQVSFRWHVLGLNFHYYITLCGSGGTRIGQ